MRQGALVIAILTLCTGCQVTTQSGMYRAYFGWRAFMEPNVVYERYALSEKQPSLWGKELRWHHLKWHDQNYKDPRYINTPVPAVSQRTVPAEELAKQSSQKLPPPEEPRSEKRVPEPQDDIPDVLKAPASDEGMPPAEPPAKPKEGPIAGNLDRTVTSKGKGLGEKVGDESPTAIPRRDRREELPGLIGPELSAPKTSKSDAQAAETKPETKSASTSGASGWIKEHATAVWKSDRLTNAMRGGRGKRVSHAKPSESAAEEAE
ncbi:MAG: hypothetical protein U0903_14905 [Planctomycetales bacterium]